jgi:hypothetical protein
MIWLCIVGIPGLLLIGVALACKDGMTGNESHDDSAQNSTDYDYFR